MVLDSKFWAHKISDWTQIITPHLCIFCEATAPLETNPAVCTECHNYGWQDYRCQRCQRSCHENETQQSRCYRCKSIHYPFKQFKSLGPYKGGLRKAILQAKFYQDPLALRYLQGISLNLKLPEKKECLWSYIPSHPKRIKERGGRGQHIPQILKRLAKFHGQSFQTLFKKIEDRRPQIELNEKERRKGLDSSLIYLEPPSKPKTVFLFDDVWTTGSTLGSACRVLNQHEINNIYVFTLAFNDLQTPRVHHSN